MNKTTTKTTGRYARSDEAEPKRYISYKRDRAALKRIVARGLKQNANYAMADGIRDALIEKDERDTVAAAQAENDA
jgi:hypothetical protein